MIDNGVTRGQHPAARPRRHRVFQPGFLAVVFGCSAMACGAGEDKPEPKPAAEPAKLLAFAEGPGALKDRQAAVFAKIDGKTVVAKRVLDRIDLEALKAGQFLLNVEKDGKPALKVQLKGKPQERDGRLKWTGAVAGSSRPCWVRTSGKNVYGNFYHGKFLYEIRPLGDGAHALVTHDVTKFLPDDGDHPPNKPEEVEAKRKAMRDLRERAGPRPARKIRVTTMVLYTPGVGSERADMEDFVQTTSIDPLNESLDNSKAAVEVKMVHIAEIDFPVTGDSLTDITTLQARGTTAADDIAVWRNTHKADFVLLMVDHCDKAGRVFKIWAGESQAFAIMEHRHYSQHTFAHEFGHLAGGCHDDDAMCPVAEGHGHLNGGKWLTIMAKKRDGIDRILHWSNPGVCYDGDPTGKSGRSHCSRVVEDHAWLMSFFR